MSSVRTNGLHNILLIFPCIKGFSGYGRCETSMKKECIYSEKAGFLSEFGKTLCKLIKTTKYSY